MCTQMFQAVTLAFSATVFPVEGDAMQWLAIVNNHEVPCEERVKAKRQLVHEQINNIAMMPHVFKVLGDPAGAARIPLPQAYAIFPGTDEDCEILPDHAQIARARLSIWEAFAERAQPENERMEMFETLFDEATTEFQVRQLINAARSNMTPTVRDHLLTIYLDQARDADIRTAAARAVMYSQMPSVEWWPIKEQIINTAWEERGSPLALRMGERLGDVDDPRVALLRIDVYERWRTTTPPDRLLIMGMQAHPDMFELHFGNISGLYRGPRPPRSVGELKQRNKRLALQQEARETGDDTKLREFEAEIEAQRQAELAHRIKRIDEWIAANRERLEAEAAAYTPPEPPVRR